MRINEDNQKIIRTIIDYFCGNENFDQYKIVRNKADVNKGLLMFGGNGVGKTLLFKIIQSAGREIITKEGYKKTHFRNISCGNFVSLFMTSTSQRFESTLSFDLKNFYKGSLYIDDLGAEQLAFNKYELLEEVLFERYRNQALTFITTNLSPSEIENRYGKRIGDRLPEMFNIIKWDGKSFREEL